MMTQRYQVMVVSWLCVLATAKSELRCSYKQARTPIMSSNHGHVFLGLCCASDSELAAAVVEVEHSVVIRVTSSEDLRLVRAAPSAKDLQSP